MRGEAGGSGYRMNIFGRQRPQWQRPLKPERMRALLATPVSVQTAMSCCFKLSVDAGSFVNVEAITRRRLLSKSEMELRELVELGPEFEITLQPTLLNWTDLITTRFASPVLLVLANGNVVTAHGVRAGDEPRAAIADPLTNEGRLVFLTREELEDAWKGIALITASVPTKVDDKRFGFAWFTRKLFAQKRIIRDICIAALAMNIMTLAVPIFFQILLDKVLPNHALTTLIALAIGVGVLLVFDTVFNYLRNFLLAHLTRGFDQSVSNEIVTHLLSLPIDFFTRGASGVLVHKLNEANNVRDFIASRLFNTFLDLSGVIIFIPVLAIYSLPLTGVILVMTAMTFMVLQIASWRFRAQLQDVNAVEGYRKGLLLEFIHGITTVKTLAIEGACLRRWKRTSADAANRGLGLGKTAASARALVTGFERAVPILIGSLGVMLVLNEKMTVGALIAFNMLGTRVSSPLIQCASLLQEYQKAKLSLRILGDFMRTEPEPKSGMLAPPLSGDVEFEDVSFSYPGQPTPALKTVSFQIKAGQTIGVIGRSGSGKTTVTRLLQKLYTAQSGIIRIDGQDVKEIDTNYLRSRIGVVLQDNFFFRGTVRENISLSRPDAPLADIIEAAQKAGAHEFVQRLPNGYMTVLEENGLNLSGGQRQRLAIARVLLNHPPILIFDEATSALDPESEALVRTSLSNIARGTATIIIVTHRLSFVRDADQIIMLDRGEISAFGKHDHLLHESLMYRQFWNQQARVFS